VGPDGRAWWVHKGALVTELHGEYFAIGSGFRLAMGALAMGATAMQAVEVCCDLDDMTRRPMMALSIEMRL
jgi:hypothetical protein